MGLLIEAGPVFSPSSHPEVITSSNIVAANFDSRFEWGYKTQPGYISHTIRAISGKVLGGSSAINGAAAGRSLPTDFSRWTDAGLDGWSGRMYFHITRKWKLQMLLTIIGMVIPVLFPSRN